MRLHSAAGGGPLPGISSANLIPSFTSMSFKPKKVRLALCHGEPFHSSRPPGLSTEHSCEHVQDALSGISVSLPGNLLLVCM